MANTKERIGIFGGTFNPLHVGHINSMLTVTKQAGLDKVYAVPNFKSPLKERSEGPSPEQRLEMVRLGLDPYKEQIVVDGQEIERGGLSYSVETINKYAKQFSPKNLHLIIGLDQFMQFDTWKDFAEILKKTNLIVTSRPGEDFPDSAEELPAGLQKLVKSISPDHIELKGGRIIHFVNLKDIDISSSEIRKRIRTGKNVDRYLPVEVEKFIRQQGLYQTRGPKISDYKKLSEFCADILFRHKAIGVKAFDLRGLEAPCEFSLIASGTSTRHAQSLAENVEKAVKEEFGIFPGSLEGKEEGRWVLLDFGSLIIHVFYDFVRAEYRLENLWKAGKDLQLTDPYENKNVK